MVILGIDPGTATTGYGLIKKTRNGLCCLDYGVIKTEPSLPQEKRLVLIYQALSQIMKKFQPQMMAIESVYFFKNLKTAFPVSEARGIMLLLACQKKIKIKQLTPLQIKMGISGYGRADKKQVQKMVKEILRLEVIPKPDDAADALAVGVCGARESS